jgi:hypothetical protein
VDNALCVAPAENTSIVEVIKDTDIDLTCSIMSAFWLH